MNSTSDQFYTNSIHSILIPSIMHILINQTYHSSPCLASKWRLLSNPPATRTLSVRKRRLEKGRVGQCTVYSSFSSVFLLPTCFVLVVPDMSVISNTCTSLFRSIHQIKSNQIISILSFSYRHTQMLNYSYSQ